MKATMSRRPAVSALALAAALLCGTALATQAQDARAAEATAVDIAAGDLAQALRQLATQMSLQIDYPAEMVAGKASQGLAGRFSTEEALSRLLAGTGLDFRLAADGRVIVEPAGSQRGADGTLKLQAIEVTGRAAQTSFAESSFAVTRTEAHVLDTPQSVSAVTKEVIRDQNLMRLNDVAPFVAGVTEFSVYDDLTIRGFRNYDDRRVNGMRAYNSFWSQPLIAHLERVEVIKGPASAMFGDVSPGGTVNMVTKKPLDTARHEIAASVGSYEERYLALDSTGPLDQNRKVLYRLNVAAEDSESFRNQYFNEGYILAPSLTLLPSDGTRVNLDIVYTNTDSVLDRGQPAIEGSQDLDEVPIELMVTQPGDKLDTQTTSINLSLEQELGEDWTVALSHMDYRYEEEMVEHRFRGYVSPSVITLGYYDREGSARVASTSAYLSGLLETGPVLHQLVFGIDLTDREDEASQLADGDVGTFDLLDPSYIDRDPSTYDLAGESWGASMTGRGVYLQDQMSIGDWQVLAGLRHQRFEVQPDGEASQTDSALVPRLSVLYNLTGDSSVYGSWITGFEPPESWVNSPTYGGPFDPMDSRLFEVGYKRLAFDGKLLFTAALYDLVKRNVVVWANDAVDPDLYIQRGEERARGLELEANGKLTQRLSLLANYAYNDAEIVDDPDPAREGLTKENAPRHSATVWGRYDLFGGFGVGAGVVYVGERETFDANLTLPDYTLLNAALYYQQENFQVSLHGNNLTDETHWTSGYYYGRVFPGAPRTFTLSAAYRF